MTHDTCEVPGLGEQNRNKAIAKYIWDMLGRPFDTILENIPTHP